jgi:hypothetical protein
VRPDYARRHLRFGWWWLLAFATLGLALEGLNGFKVGAYLDVSNETRRTMWRLAHTHGALLGVVHILFGLTLRTSGEREVPRLHLISLTLFAAAGLLPAGFLLGGVSFYGGDPGLGVLLVPVGAVLLLVGLWLTAVAVGTWTADPRPRSRDGSGAR